MSAAGAAGPSILATLARSIVLMGTVAAANAGRRVGSAVGGYLLVAALFAISLCFLTFAGYRAISLALGSIYASLIVGCVYLFAGLVATLLLQMRRRRPT